MRQTLSASLLLALLVPATGTAGIVIVNHDEWTLSNLGVNAAQFGANIANYFAGGPGGNFLIYSNDTFGLANSTLINAITSAGHTVTVNTGITFDLPTLSAYTGIFLGGYVGSYSAAVLTDYVNNGGNVYLAGGTGSIAFEDSVWDPFLANFGFNFGFSYNGIAGTFAPTTSHPIFAGVPSLLYNNGNTVLLTGSTLDARLIAVHPVTGDGLIGIYERTGEGGGGGEIPEPSTLALVGAGLLAAGLLRRR